METLASIGRLISQHEQKLLLLQAMIVVLLAVARHSSSLQVMTPPALIGRHPLLAPPIGFGLSGRSFTGDLSKAHLNLLIAFVGTYKFS
jgi:hypothetical protein